MRRLLALAGLGLALGGLAAPAAAQADDAAIARRRWEAKSPDERALLRERFAELKALGDEDRRALIDLAGELKAREEEERTKLSAVLRERLAGLPPPDRHGVFREHLRDVLRREGEIVRERLPEHVLAELEAVPPARRPLRLEKLLRGDRPLQPQAVRRLGESLGVAHSELAELDGLAQEELEERALRFHREQIGRRVRELGPPPGIDASGYAALSALPHREFFRRWRALDPPEIYGAPPASENGSRAPAPPDERPFALARERAALIAQALRLLQPTFAERVELAGLDVDARALALAARARERCLAFVAEHGLLAPGELAQLSAEEGRGFERLAHRMLAARKKALYGERGERGGAAEPRESRRRDAGPPEKRDRRR